MFPLSYTGINTIPTLSDTLPDKLLGEQIQHMSMEEDTPGSCGSLVHTPGLWLLC